MIISPHLWVENGPTDEDFTTADTAQEATALIGSGAIVAVPSVEMAMLVLEQLGASEEWLHIRRSH